MRKGEWKFFNSAVTLDELTEAPERIRVIFEEAFVTDDLIALSEETDELATHYITQVVLTPRFTDDARACCRLHDCQARLFGQLEFSAFGQCSKEKPDLMP